MRIVVRRVEQEIENEMVKAMEGRMLKGVGVANRLLKECLVGLHNSPPCS
jgi:hypothetical protein